MERREASERFKLRSPRDYSKQELLEIAAMAGECLDGSDFDDVWLSWRSVKIDKYHLLVFIDRDGELFMEVNGSCSVTRQINISKGAVLWRWFYRLCEEALDDVRNDHPHLRCYCVPEDRDGNFDRRVKFFERLGFTLINETEMILDR
jgi:hypothetical protein